MPGEVWAYGVYQSSYYDDLATFPLVAYLVATSIVLLHILIIFLSTANEKIDESAERESRASKVRVAKAQIWASSHAEYAGAETTNNHENPECNQWCRGRGGLEYVVEIWRGNVCH